MPEPDLARLAGGRAGLQPGDLITAINGKTVTSTDAFIATVDNFQPGQTVTMTVKRGGKTAQHQGHARDATGVQPARRLTKAGAT